MYSLPPFVQNLIAPLTSVLPYFGLALVVLLVFGALNRIWPQSSIVRTVCGFIMKAATFLWSVAPTVVTAPLRVTFDSAAVQQVADAVKTAVANAQVK